MKTIELVLVLVALVAIFAVVKGAGPLAIEGVLSLSFGTVALVVIIVLLVVVVLQLARRK